MAQSTIHRMARSGLMPGRLPAIARSVAALEGIVGIGAIFGGGLLILGPDGHLLGVPISMLAGTPFDSFLLPGILLFSCVGVVPLTAATLTLRRSPSAPLAALVVGLLLMGWIVGEMVILGGLGTLAWAGYLIVGTVITVVGVVWVRSAARDSTAPD